VRNDQGRNDQGRRDVLRGLAGAALAVPGLVGGEAAAQTPAAEYRSVGELNRALIARQVSSRELVDRAIARIEATDGAINAVVVRDFERARAAAAEADAALARGERRPLLGIPMTIKEAVNLAGLPTTWGIPAFKDWRPNEDAVTAARLKAAGAVILGKTNLPLRLADWQSYNDIYGATNNPWDLGRTPGGSSGGAAAALAAGYVPLELGSDIAGSIRAPAHYCGVFGHKPSYGVVPLRGHQVPRTEASGGDGGLSVVGPLARSAADLELALDVLAGPDRDEAVAYRLVLPAARHDELRRFRVLVIDTHPLHPAAESVRLAIRQLAERLGRAGATVADRSPLLPDLAQIARTFVPMLSSYVSQGRPREYYAGIEATLTTLPADDQSLLTLLLRGAVLSHRDWLAANATRARLARQWRELNRDWDVVLCPAMSTPAFPHDHSPDARARRIDIDGKAYPYLDQFFWPAIATLLGLPTTVAPIGRSPEGLPIGVQIIGPQLEDRTTLAFARLIEREFGGFVPPPSVAK
jgi:amidase